MARRTISAKNERGIKIGESWVDFHPEYEGIPHEQIQPGREYEIDFVKDKEQNKWFVKKVAPVNGNGEFWKEKYEEERRKNEQIARMNALTNAVSFHQDDPQQPTVEQVLETARKFYRFIVEG